MSALRPVAILCAASQGVYRSIPGVVVYDRARDAFNFPGDMPIVAHPPCRAWSAYCRHQAKPLPGEKELGLFCAEQLRLCGGVLENPAHSRLYDASRLPRPGRDQAASLWTIQVWQAWWGYGMRKSTWLCFSGINPRDVHVPFRLHVPNGDRRRQQVMSHNQRAATCPALAHWLVDLARKASV